MDDEEEEFFDDGEEDFFLEDEPIFKPGHVGVFEDSPIASFMNMVIFHDEQTVEVNSVIFEVGNIVKIQGEAGYFAIKRLTFRAPGEYFHGHEVESYAELYGGTQVRHCFRAFKISRLLPAGKVPRVLWRYDFDEAPKKRAVRGPVGRK